MNSIVDSDIQRFVACLVLGYLENQQLQKAYTSFCETSRHLAKEKKGLKYGNKPLDTSVGLVNIIREYFSIKARINEFLRMSPQSPIIIQLIDTNDTLLRLDIILKAFKESLNKTDSVPGETVKKRKHESPNVFEVSQTNTSTPETLNPSKRPRKSLTTPFLTISDKKENKSRSIDRASTSRVELKYSSTSDTSEKEDDSVEEGKVFSPSPASPESPVLTVKPEKQLSETLLKKPEFAEHFAEIINKTLLARETEPTASDLGSQEIMITNDDIDNILSGTQKEMSFDDIVNDLVKDLYPLNQESAGPSHRCEKVLTASTDSELHEEIPIKQRLRPRNEKNHLPSERKKVTIISNEPYTGVIPAVANVTRFTSTYSEVPQFVLNLPSYLQSELEMIPVIQTVPSMIPSVIASTSGIVTNASSETLTTTTSRDIVQVQPTSFSSELTSSITIVAEKKQTTPKVTLYPSFLNSKCRSTPRRKATHVRILDFTQTPSHQKLESVKEFSTPNNGIQQATPGSAPATIGLFKSALKEVADTNIVKIEVVPDAEDNSNSNSISKTPKVAKNPRRRKIADSKTEEMTKLEAESKSAEKELDKPLTLDPEKPCSIADWKEMRLKSKTMTIDQQVRSVYEKAESNGSVKKRRKAKKPLTTKQQALKNKLSNKSPVELKGKMKSPLKKAPKNTTKKEKSSSEEIDENKPLSAIKLRISSPRKVAAAAKKNSPKKRNKSVPQSSKEKFKQQGENKLKKKNEVEPTVDIEAEPVVSELNRSDTVQEVATVLSTLSDTILAENNTVMTVETPEADAGNKSQIDSGIEQNPMLETPFKEPSALIDDTPFKNQTLTPLPNTPRFAIPLVSTAQETPTPKIFASSQTLVSLVKNSDIMTPNFPITPGFKETPLKDLLDGSPASGYCSRRTDYSSCSSYYKPDESEDIAGGIINAIVNQKKSERSERNSQSESDGGVSQIDGRLHVLRSVKKVECPGAIERVKSFTEEQNDLPTPHYEMMEEGLLSETMMTTATDDSDDSSSSFTCSTCSTTDDSDDENTMDKLNKLGVEVTDEKDSEWDCEDQEVVKEVVATPPIVMNEKTGEVRFPLRNWITPKKIEVDQEQTKINETNKIKSLLNENDPRRGISVQEEHERRIKHMEEVKQRTLQKIRSETGCAKNRLPEQKFKKTNVKAFKLPPLETAKPTTTTRKEKILQQDLTERPRPTPLKLIPSSSTRRKNPTPRKTITINELPRQPSPKKKKKSEATKKSPNKSSERLSLESVLSDNAIMPEDSKSLEVSSLYNTSNEEETASTVITNKAAEVRAVVEEGSNTFQRSMIAQGFDKTEAKELQSELVDKLEVALVAEKEKVVEKVETESLHEDKSVPGEAELDSKVESEMPEKVTEPEHAKHESQEESEESSSDEDDEELDFCLAEENEKNSFSFIEQENFKPCVLQSKPPTIPKMILKYPDQTVTLQSSGVFDIFSIEPTTAKPKKSPKKQPKEGAKATNDSKKSNGKDSPNKSSKKKSTFRWEQSTTIQVERSEVQALEKPKLKINIKEKNLEADVSSTATFDIRAILDKVHGK